MVGVALFVGLIAASAVGVLLSIILFLREQVGGSVIRRKSFVRRSSSTWYRPEAEMQILEQRGKGDFSGDAFKTIISLFAHPEIKRAATAIKNKFFMINSPDLC